MTPMILDHPLIQHKLSLLRNKNTGSKEFRELVGEISMLMCYEATRDLPLKEIEVETPVAIAKTKIIAGRKLAFVPILRAGIGVLDPMLATGGSAVEAIKILKEKGAVNVKFMCVIASPEGMKALTEAHPDVQVYCAALDEKLNDEKFIVPGLGDAGDRIFGTK